MPRCVQSDLPLGLGQPKRSDPVKASCSFCLEVTWRFLRTPSTRTDRYDSPTGRSLGTACSKGYASIATATVSLSGSLACDDDSEDDEDDDDGDDDLLLCPLPFFVVLAG